jgi:hypothetical protein
MKTSKRPSINRYRRPPRDLTISVRIDRALFETINQEAEAREMSIADIVRARLKVGISDLKNAAA